MKLKRLSVTIASTSVAPLLVAMTGIGQAQATSSSIGGTVNCGGYTHPTLYNTTRFLSELGPITFHLTNGVGSTYGSKQLRIGVYLVKNGVYQSQRDLDLLADPVYPSSATLLVSGYLVGTAFRMVASMSASNGACDNTWAGNLNF